MTNEVNSSRKTKGFVTRRLTNGLETSRFVVAIKAVSHERQNRSHADPNPPAPRSLAACRYSRANTTRAAGTRTISGRKFGVEVVSRLFAEGHAPASESNLRKPLRALLGWGSFTGTNNTVSAQQADATAVRRAFTTLWMHARPRSRGSTWGDPA